MTSDELQTRLREIVARYPSARSAMLPCLHLAQEETATSRPKAFRRWPRPSASSPTRSSRSSTFYSMYSQEPKGRYVIKVCTSISCYLRGCDDMIAYLEERLGIQKGRDDQRWALYPGVRRMPGGLRHGACDTGEWRFVENVTTRSARCSAIWRTLARSKRSPGDQRWARHGDGHRQRRLSTAGSTDDRE